MTESQETELQQYDLPEDPLWMQDKMRVRHAALIRGEMPDLELAVRRLDEYGHRMGCRRHGKLDYETWGFGPDLVHGISSHFAIYDMGKHAKFLREIERTSERRRVMAEIRTWPWWRRLFVNEAIT